MFDTIKSEIDDVIINKNKRLGINSFYGLGQTGSGELHALYCFRYIIEDILQWSPETAIKKFDTYMIDSLGIRILTDYIEFPDEIDEATMALYILSLLYPRQVRLNEEDLIILTYKRIMTGERKQFPRDYFSGGEGFRRACFIIKYIIENNVPFTNIKDIYEFFYYDVPSKNYLINQRLKVPIYHYGIDIFDVIHAITQDYDDSDLWFNYYMFKRELDRKESPNGKASN